MESSLLTYSAAGNDAGGVGVEQRNSTHNLSNNSNNITYHLYVSPGKTEELSNTKKRGISSSFDTVEYMLGLMNSFFKPNPQGLVVQQDGSGAPAHTC